MMNDKEIQEVLGRGKPSTYSFDPNIKTEITRATLDVAVRDIKRSEEHTSELQSH